MSTGLNIALVGYGKMGRTLERIAASRGHRVALRVDPHDRGADRAVLDAADLAGVDVALEFTHAEAAAANCGALLAARVPVVCGTTGWADGLGAVRRLATETGTGFLWAPNYALGVQVTFRLARAAAQWLARVGGFAPYLVEEHHQAKRDAPSGTARRLAEILVENTPGKKAFGLAPADAALPPELVPVAWVRAGAIPGTHRVGWDGTGETLEIVHRARGREIFADGAVTAAEWLKGHPGPRTLDEMLDDMLAGAGH